MNRLYAYGILAVLIAGAIGWHLFSDYRVKSKLAQTKANLELATAKVASLEASLLEVTNEKTAMDAKVQSAQKAQTALQVQLSQKIAELRKVPAPLKCEDQIPWLYESAK